MRKNITCMVYAKLNSHRVERKMVRPFADSCLIEIALKKLLSCSFLDKNKIYLGAYDPEIKSIGEKLGVKIYNRTLESTIEPVTMDVFYKYLHDLNLDYVLEVNACNPLLDPETLNRALETFHNNDYQSLFSVVKRKNFYFREDGSMLNGFLGDPKYIPTLETKLVEPIYEAGHCIYIWKADRVKTQGIRWDLKPNDPYLFEIPPEEAFDIDYPWQFDLAEQMYIKKYLKK